MKDPRKTVQLGPCLTSFHGKKPEPKGIGSQHINSLYLSGTEEHEKTGGMIFTLASRKPSLFVVQFS